MLSLSWSVVFVRAPTSRPLLSATPEHSSVTQSSPFVQQFLINRMIQAVTLFNKSSPLISLHPALPRCRGSHLCWWTRTEFQQRIFHSTPHHSAPHHSSHYPLWTSQTTSRRSYSALMLIEPSLPHHRWAQDHPVCYPCLCDVSSPCCKATKSGDGTGPHWMCHTRSRLWQSWCGLCRTTAAEARVHA